MLKRHARPYMPTYIGIGKFLRIFYGSGMKLEVGDPCAPLQLYLYLVPYRNMPYKHMTFLDNSEHY
jgi:hypothetical protein